MKSQSPELFRLSCHLRRETANAVLIHDDASMRSTWIPRSTIVGDIVREAGDVAVITMRRWLAAEKGLL